MSALGENPFVSSIFDNKMSKKGSDLSRPKTPYIKDKEGKNQILSLYARDQSRRELIDILVKGTKIKEPKVSSTSEIPFPRSGILSQYDNLKANPHLNIDINELNLLKIRETTYNRYEQEYRESMLREYQAIRKKSMLSRNPLVTFSSKF